MTINKTLNIKNLYNIFLVVYPILNVYSSGIGSLSLAMVFSLLFSLIGIISIFKKDKIKVGIIGFDFSYLYLIIFMLFFSLLTSLKWGVSSPSRMIFDFGKLLVWAILISVNGYTFVDYERFKKMLIQVGLISSAFLLVQYFGYHILNIRIPNVLNIGFIRPNYEYFEISDGIISNSLYRPSSFFGEPAHYGYYGILTLILLLNIKIHSKREYIYIAIVTLAIILSGSTGGIVSVGIVYLLSIIFTRKISVLKKIMLLFSALILVIIFSILEIDLVSFFGTNLIEKIDYTILKLSSLENLGRVGSSYTKVLSFINESMFLGKGIGNATELNYLNSVATILAWNGFLGLIAFFIFCFVQLKRSRTLEKITVLFLYSISGFYSALYFSPVSVLYLTIIYCQSKRGDSSCE